MMGEMMVDESAFVKVSRSVALMDVQSVPFAVLALVGWMVAWMEHLLDG